MKDQPKALRLADYMDDALNDPNDVADAVSSELRHLHAENERLTIERDEARRTAREAHEMGTRVVAQRDALLEALKDIAGTDPVDAALDPQRAVRIARAAIKAVEEGK